MRKAARIIWTPIRRWVQGLGPYTSLVVVAVALAIVEPLKLVGAVVAGTGPLLTAQAGVTDAERLGVKEHDGKARRFAAAIDPGVVGAALDHDVAGAQLHRGVVHVHVNLTGQHSDVVDGFGAMHLGGDAGGEFHDDEAGAVFRRRGAETGRAHVPAPPPP